MGTIGELVVWTNDDNVGERAREETLRVFDTVSRLMAPHGDTDVTRINRLASRQAVRVHPMTYEVIERAQLFARTSNGLFDITFAALNGVWRLDDLHVLPDDNTISSLLGRVDWRAVALAQGEVRLARPTTVISLNGIAKGYAVDRAVAALRALGVRDFILKLGGDLYASGKRGNQRWRIGVRDPRGADSFAEMEVEDAAFSTSGDYERFAFLDGKRYHHILDPRTGYPATASRAVSVLATDAITAEGLTKVLFIAGQDPGILRHFPGSEAVIVTAANAVWTSPGLKQRLRVLHPPTDAK